MEQTHEKSIEERCRDVLRDWGWTEEQIQAWSDDVDALVELLESE